MATSSTKDGTVNQKLLDYYAEKSAGGYLGLFITEHSYVNQQGIAHSGQISVSHDSDIDGLKKLVNVIHQNGTKVFAQINHAGSATSQKVTGMKTVGASAVLNEGLTGKNGELPEEMTTEQINQVVNDFAESARRVKEAGFDGVEIHSAHGYLLNQFYSPLTNKRKDEYSAYTIEARIKIHKEIIHAIRDKVGKDYIIGLRLGGCDYREGGSTIEDSVKAAVLLESYGVDMLDISGGMNGYLLPGRKEPGYFSGMAEKIREKVSIPVLLAGGITDLQSAEYLLQAGKADLIGVGRAILKDSLWARNMMERAEL